MSYNNAIKSDDPQAIEKLTEKLTVCEQSQAYMKEVNAYYRKMGTCKGCPDVSDDFAAKLNHKVEHGYSWEKSPFSSYELTNNNEEIRRLKSRIKELTVNQEVGFVGWQFDGGEVIANSEDNRLQMFFEEKPDERKRSVLKSADFKWAPSVGAWQRQLNSNAIYAASRVDFIKPKSGESPIKLQPKAPHKEAQER